MNTVTITKENALKAYSLADDNGKKMLIALLGETPKPEKITDRIKTFEDACNALDIEPNDVLHSAHSNYLEKDIDSINAYSMLIVIARALNEGWEPDWSDKSQYKYIPWFNLSSASGFAYDVYVGWHSTSAVGSRLCFKSSELAIYAGKQFESLYKEYFLIK